MVSPSGIYSSLIVLPIQIVYQSWWVFLPQATCNMLSHTVFTCFQGNRIGILNEGQIIMQKGKDFVNPLLTVGYWPFFVEKLGPF